MKLIKPTDAYIEKALERFKTTLLAQRSTNGKVKFEEDLLKLSGIVEEKREVRFTADAFLKIRELVSSTSTEIAWHGLVKQDLENDTYIVYDIIMYPQKVTGVTVITDDEKYAAWLMGVDDEIFDNVRMQGHSHVRMGVSPSGTDTNYYNDILQTLDKDDFYIFMITNKQGDVNIWIHELSNNFLFEPKDINIVIEDSAGNSISSLIQKLKNQYVEEAPKPVATGLHKYAQGYYGNPHYYGQHDDAEAFLDERYGKLNAGKGKGKNKGKGVSKSTLTLKGGKK